MKSSISDDKLLDIFEKSGVSKRNATSILNCIYKYYDKNAHNSLTIDDVLNIDFEKFSKVRRIGKKKLNELNCIRNYLRTGIPMKKEERIIGVDTSKRKDKTHRISLDDVKGVLLSHIKELKEKDDEIRKELDRMFPGIRALESWFSTQILIAAAHNLLIFNDQTIRLYDLEKISHEINAKYSILKQIAENFGIDLEPSQENPPL